MADNTHKFDGKSDAYAAGRPAYAEALLDELYNERGFSAESSIADVGSGTGIFSRQLLLRGSRVFCVEPNHDMRQKAEKNLATFGRFTSVDGDASATGLDDASVDHVTCAQAFHWFDADGFRRECGRILRPGGLVALVWNSRVAEAPINVESGRLFSRLCPKFKGFSGGVRQDDERIIEFFRGDYEKIRFENHLAYDRDKFVSRSLSGSYALREGEEGYDDLVEGIRGLFGRFEQDGVLVVPNETVAYLGTVS